ncbi:MAG TPA: DUF5134 domain-containing protein [Acidimicrobiales bacterium]|jgi:hypothetical protein|nr:DUF5134 domain-containing protein [Acidimicrobiales bacterium]
MAHPAWIPYSFAALMVGVSLYCIGRLVLARRWRRRTHADVNVFHVVMGAAMAGMLVPAHNPLSSAAGEAIFSLSAAWFLAEAIRFARRYGLKGSDEDLHHHISHPLIHMLMAGAMVYMYAAMAPAARGSAMSAMGTGVAQGPAALTLALILVLFGSAVWQLDTIDRFSPAQLRLSSGTLGAPGAGWNLPRSSADEIDTDQPASELGAAATRPMLTPRLEVLCHVVMCVTMGYMLILML